MQIPLSKGLFAIVDEADYERVSQFKWCASWSGKGWYALRRIKGTGQPGKKEKLHQFITRQKFVDHINGDGLDCRRDNLRPATIGENSRNRGRQIDNTSGYKGVTIKRAGTQRRKTDVYVAQIKVNRGIRYLGSFKTAKQAALAYDQAARELHGVFARLNFSAVVA